MSDRIGLIVSGGQTGADQGALDAAIRFGQEYAGRIPKGRKSEAGPIPLKYSELTELNSPDYVKRTEANVKDSDCTVIFTYGPPTGGSLKTQHFAKEHGRPCLCVDLDRVTKEEAVAAIVKWLHADCPKGCALNCAGSRESKAPGIQTAVDAIVFAVLGEVNRVPDPASNPFATQL